MQYREPLAQAGSDQIQTHAPGERNCPDLVMIFGRIIASVR
jgi:hypothetical protein